MGVRGGAAVLAVVAALVLLAPGCKSSTDDAGPEATTTAPSSGGTAASAAPGGGASEGARQLRPSVEPTGRTLDGTVTTADGRTRGYRLYVPSSLPTDQPVPLLVGLHGATGWAQQFETNSQYDGLAEANGVLVAYLEGVGAGPNADAVFGSAIRTWNGGACCGPAQRQQVDDVAFVRAVIDQVAASHDVDPSRVWATGHSNGAIMSYRLACELSDRITAVAFYAGTLELPTCAPTRPVSLMHVHGTGDRNIPYAGGIGDNGISGISFPSPVEGVHRFAAADGCPADPTTTASATDPNVSTTLWSPCGDGSQVELVTIQGATHAWPGSTARAAGPNVGTPYPDYDASAQMLAFLLAHPRPT